jgi:putative hydrolase of the HAD superfamily
MKEIPLDAFDVVLLDLDGTLLDKYFDDYFWGHLVPEHYAERHDVSFGRARDVLYDIYKSHEGTLKWTDLDFWSEELALDIPALKEQLRHLIEVHPHVEHFLMEMRRMGKPVHLLTNAHWKSVKLKFRETGIGRHFESVITSNEIGAPKEDIAFFERARAAIGFDPARALFVDDTEEVLHVARRFGIRFVVFKGRSSSRVEPRKSGEFLSITDFDELLA